MDGQHRGRAQADGDLANPSWTQKKRPDSAEEPIAHSEVRRTLARTAQHDQRRLEQEMLSDDGSHAAGSAELRGGDGQVKPGEQEILHARDSVGQNSGATQWCPRPRFSDRIRNSRPTSPYRMRSFRNVTTFDNKTDARRTLAPLFAETAAYGSP